MPSQISRSSETSDPPQILSVSYFNLLRFEGLPLREAIMQGAGKRVRPMMTALMAVFGRLPAALSTRIGSQSQRPLAIVVVGGMIQNLLLNRYLMHGAVQLLRPARTAQRRRRPGPLTTVAFGSTGFEARGWHTSPAPP